MISVSGKKWEQKKTNKNSIEKLKQDYNFSDILSRLVISRKFDQTELSSIDNDLDLNKKYELNEIVKGDSIFCATGITTSDVLSSIDIKGNNYTSETFVTHKSSHFKEIIKRTNYIKE